MEKYTILIVDDEKSRHDLFKKKYSRHILTHAYNSKEALKYLRKNKYEIVFLDHDLGGTDTGVPVAEWIKKKGKNIKVIIHSMNSVGAQNLKAILPDSRILPGAFM